MPARRFAAATRLRDSVPLAKLRLGTRQVAPPPAPAAPAPRLSWARLLALKLHCAPCTGVRLSCLNEVILVSLCGDSLSVVIFSVLKSLYRPFRERHGFFTWFPPLPSRGTPPLTAECVSQKRDTVASCVLFCFIHSADFNFFLNTWI